MKMPNVPVAVEPTSEYVEPELEKDEGSAVDSDQ